MTNETERIQNAIRHIQTAVDIDPWAVEIAVEAMEKQIPKKTKQFEMGLDGKIIIPCGNCESTLDGDWDYCPFCGQNILWRVKGDTTGSD